MRIEKIWFDGNRIYARFEDGRTLWQSLLYYRNLMNAENKDDYVIEDDGVHWYGLDEDISNESFEYEDPEPKGLSKILLSHPELNLSAIARRMGLQQSLLAAYSSGMKRPSKAREHQIISEFHKIGTELLSIGSNSLPAAGFGKLGEVEINNDAAENIVSGYSRNPVMDRSCHSTGGVLRDEGIASENSIPQRSSKSLPDLLRESLQRKGMSQKELAKQLSVSPSRVNAYITGRSIPTLKIAAKICHALSISAAEILGTQEES